MTCRLMRPRQKTLPLHPKALSTRLHRNSTASISVLPRSKRCELSSSEMQKLASLGYVGIQKSNTASAATGTDPKDAIATANKVESALQALDDGKPEKAVPIFQQVLANSASVYLAQYGLGSALAQLQQCQKAIEPLRKAIELQPDSRGRIFKWVPALLRRAITRRRWSPGDCDFPITRFW